jgi:hypothetical protein
MIINPPSPCLQTEIPAEQQRQLELMCQFDYAEGVIERVQFAQNDSIWSQNIKRGVLQMIQLNLNQKNAQGPRQEEEDQQQQENKENDQEVANDSLLTNSFTIPEINVEGQCQTTYSINAANPNQVCMRNDNSTRPSCSSFNVTKSINFNQCSRMPDVAFGHQNQEQEQQQCAQCQAEQQANGGQHQCANCDTKEVKEQKVRLRSQG